MNPTPKLNKAIALVMAEVKRQGAKDENKFANYKYTSVDDYKDHLRPILAKNGLAVRSDQIDFSIADVIGKDDKRTIVARFDMAFWLVHESGDEEAPERTTVMLPFIGAQTTGQARSYAQKEWIKSKFLATSGDKPQDIDAPEADALEQSEYASTRLGPADFPREVGDPSARQSKGPFEILSDAMMKQGSWAELNKWWKASAKEIKQMNAQFQWDFFDKTVLRGLDLCQKKLEVELFWSFHEDRFNKLKEKDIVRYETLEEQMLNKVDKLNKREHEMAGE